MVFLIYLAISFICGAITYVCCCDLICTLIVLVIYLAFFMVFFHNKTQKDKKRINKYLECCHFINSFVISLSVKGSLVEAYSSASQSISEELQSINKLISDKSEYDRLIYLIKYFDFHLYSLFISVINLWQEQGNDILKCSYGLLDEIRNNEDYIINAKRLNKQKTVEFISLWFISSLILVILRFALYQYYDKLKNEMFYKICIVGFFIVILLSIYIYMIRTTGDLKGCNEENETKK